MKFSIVLGTACLVAVLGSFGKLAADPCGMVPPIYPGGQLPPLARIGEQKTFVFYKDGIETFVIQPGFSGKVDDFGMLIPFPTPPAIRKVPDNIFAQIAAAIDPPEVVVDLTPRPSPFVSTNSTIAFTVEHQLEMIDSVRVLREEAVGMYEVAVLEAGRAAALQRWMDDHGYKYPTGMDKACQQYVDDGWCFVAVKTRVGRKRGVDPQPGQRAVDASLPPGSAFDGNVQAMGFRFHSKEFVVPMKLSAFNEGKLSNIVYILTDSPKRIRSIAEEYVVRQIPGNELYRNVVSPAMLERIQRRLSHERWKSITNVVIKSGPTQPRLRPGVGMAIMRHCLAALEEMHNRGIVHGDRAQLDRIGHIDPSKLRAFPSLED